MTSAESVSTVLRGFCFQLQRKKEQNIFWGVWGVVAMICVFCFIRIWPIKREIVSISSSLIWYYVTSRKQRHGLLTGNTREQMVCVGSSALHQHTLHFIFFCSDALCHLPSRPSLRSNYRRHIFPYTGFHILLLWARSNLKKERKKGGLGWYFSLSARLQQGVSYSPSPPVFTKPICKQNMPRYITRLLWRAFFFIFTTEGTPI